MVSIHKHRHKRSMLVRTVTLLIDQNPIEIDKRLRITAYSVTKTVFLPISICSFGLMPASCADQAAQLNENPNTK